MKILTNEHCRILFFYSACDQNKSPVHSSSELMCEALLWPLTLPVGSAGLHRRQEWGRRAPVSLWPLLVPVWKTSGRFPSSSVTAEEPATTTPTPTATGSLRSTPTTCSGTTHLYHCYTEAPSLLKWFTFRSVSFIDIGSTFCCKTHHVVLVILYMWQSLRLFYL